MSQVSLPSSSQGIGAIQYTQVGSPFKPESDELEGGGHEAHILPDELLQLIKMQPVRGTAEETRSTIESGMRAWSMAIAAFLQCRATFPADLRAAFVTWLVYVKTARADGVRVAFYITPALVNRVCPDPEIESLVASIQSPYEATRLASLPPLISEERRRDIITGCIHGSLWLRLREIVARRPRSTGADIQEWADRVMAAWTDVERAFREALLDIPITYKNEVHALYDRINQLVQQGRILPPSGQRPAWLSESRPKTLITFRHTLSELAGQYHGKLGEAFQQLWNAGSSPDLVEGDLASFLTWMGRCTAALESMLEFANEAPTQVPEAARVIYALFADIELQWAETFRKEYEPILERNSICLAPLLLLGESDTFQPWDIKGNTDEEGYCKAPHRLFMPRYAEILRAGMRALRQGESIVGGSIGRACCGMRSWYRYRCPCFGRIETLEVEFVTRLKDVVLQRESKMPVGPMYFRPALRRIIPPGLWLDDVASSMGESDDTEVRCQRELQREMEDDDDLAANFALEAYDPADGVLDTPFAQPPIHEGIPINPEDYNLEGNVFAQASSYSRNIPNSRPGSDRPDIPDPVRYNRPASPFTGPPAPPITVLTDPEDEIGGTSVASPRTPSSVAQEAHPAKRRRRIRPLVPPADDIEAATDLAQRLADAGVPFGSSANALRSPVLSTRKSAKSNILRIVGQLLTKMEHIHAALPR